MPIARERRRANAMRALMTRTHAGKKGLSLSCQKRQPHTPQEGEDWRFDKIHKLMDLWPKGWVQVCTQALSYHMQFMHANSGAHKLFNSPDPPMRMIRCSSHEPCLHEELYSELQFTEFGYKCSGMLVSLHRTRRAVECIGIGMYSPMRRCRTIGMQDCLW